MLDVMRALSRPKVAIMLALGFGSGLPFLLIGNTFNYWLADSHADLAVIGYASWIGLPYAFKFIFGAVVDNFRLPLIGRLGQRRSWLLVTQCLVAAGLLGMAVNHPPQQLTGLVLCGLLTALAAATQDTVVDAWRIEIAEDSAELDLLTSSYSLGYRIAVILTGSVILFMAGRIGWQLSYAAFAGAMLIAITATTFAGEPATRAGAQGASPLAALVFTIPIALAVWAGFEAYHLAAAWAPKAAGAIPGFASALPIVVLIVIATLTAPGRRWAESESNVFVRPFIAFFKQVGPIAVLILLVAATFHLCDYLRGPVMNPFYVRVGLSKDLVGATRLTVGIASAMVGIAAGGVFASRFGHMPALVAGAILQPLAVAAFAVLAVTGPNPAVFSGVMAFDDFCMSFAGVALVVYISTLTSGGYTATQYALFTSALAWVGKSLKGFSGAWVKSLVSPATDLTHAYAIYFIYAAIGAGAPALVLVLMLWAARRRSYSAAAPVEASALTS